MENIDISYIYESSVLNLLIVFNKILLMVTLQRLQTLLSNKFYQFDNILLSCFKERSLSFILFFKENIFT